MDYPRSFTRATRSRSERHEDIRGQAHHRWPRGDSRWPAAAEHYEVKRFTTWGFEWTYEGESPQQLALAILYDHLGDKERAIALSEPFMKQVVANLDNDWTLTSAEIDAAIKEIEALTSGGGPPLWNGDWHEITKTTKHREETL